MKSIDQLIPELSDWNNGKGIDVGSWITCMGNTDLAIGYSTVFWPAFVLYEGYVLPAGFSESSLRGFEHQCKSDRRAVEAVMNHFHIAYIHNDERITAEKVVYLGRVLKDIYSAKLAWQFPDRACTVTLYEPENKEDFASYELTFWQTAHEVEQIDDGNSVTPPDDERTP